MLGRGATGNQFETCTRSVAVVKSSALGALETTRSQYITLLRSMVNGLLWKRRLSRLGLSLTAHHF